MTSYDNRTQTIIMNELSYGSQSIDNLIRKLGIKRSSFKYQLNRLIWKGLVKVRVRNKEARIICVSQ